MPPVTVLSNCHGAQQLGGVKQLLFDLTLLLKTDTDGETQLLNLKLIQKEQGFILSLGLS